MTIQDDYELLSWSENSGITLGETSDLVKLYQEMIGSSITGTWAEVDEAAYRVYADSVNWKIIRDVIETPSFWDLCLPQENLLDLEF